MSDTPINDLLPRVAVLEEIAASTKQILAEIRAEMRDIRTEIRDMRTEMRDMRQRQERDFRLLFGAIILVAIGLAGLIARTQHWI
jgi:predicted  nucleic acid-binding Zn-ribbon protein